MIAADNCGAVVDVFDAGATGHGFESRTLVALQRYIRRIRVYVIPKYSKHF